MAALSQFVTACTKTFLTMRDRCAMVWAWGASRMATQFQFTGGFAEAKLADRPPPPTSTNLTITAHDERRTPLSAWLAARPAETVSPSLWGERAGRVLHLGCGNGEQLAQARARGWSVCGSDEDAALVQEALVKGLHVRLGGMDVWSEEGASFDLVLIDASRLCRTDVAAFPQQAERLLRRRGRVQILSEIATTKTAVEVAEPGGTGEGQTLQLAQAS